MKLGALLLRTLEAAALLLLVYQLYTLGLRVLWPLVNNPLVLQTDFHYYYDAAVRFSQDRSRLYLATDDYIAGFAYPPLAILPFLLMSKLPLGAALLGLTLASYAAVIGAVMLWCKYLRDHGIPIDATTARAVTMIALALGPTYMNATFGQVNALVLLSCVAFLTLSAVRPIAAGVLLACGMWLKLYPIVMIAVGAWSRPKWRAIAIAGIAAIALMAIALPIVPLSAHRSFLFDVLPARIDKTAIHILNQSLVAFLERFQVAPDRYLQWSGEQAIAVSGAIRAVNWGFSIGVLFYLWWRAEAGFRLSLVASDAVVMAVLAMVAPLGWGHTYMLVLPLVIFRLVMIDRTDRAQAVVVFCCVAALMVPAGRLFSFANQWPGWLQNLLYSRYLLATAILAVLSVGLPQRHRDTEKSFSKFKIQITNSNTNTTVTARPNGTSSWTRALFEKYFERNSLCLCVSVARLTARKRATAEKIRHGGRTLAEIRWRRTVAVRSTGGVMQQQSEAFDAIVVGSGISGGWAAKELTERGLRVLMLERGKNIEHVKDYSNARKAPWEYPHRGGRTREMADTYPVLKRDYPLNEKNLDWWASDKDSPYTEVKRFDWYRGYHVGGRSLTWGRQSYRLSDFDFDANAKEGIAADWPIRYADLAPWYDHVERHAGIAGSVEGLPQLPDGQFQPAMPLNCAEETIAGRLAKQFEGRRRIIPGRVANLTRPIGGRGRCVYRNACWLGCPSGSYFSTQSSTLPAAMATGRLTLKIFSIVTDVVYDRDRKRATGVRVMDAASGATTEYTAKVVFLCASTMNSTWLLMRSAREVWPGGLGSSSGELGHNLMDHHFRCGANGTVVEHNDRNVYGRRPTGFYIPRYRNFFGDKREYLRGFGYQGSASRQGWERAVAELGVGGAFKDAMATPGQWRMGATAFGEMLPNHANRITIDENRKDKWGLPVLAVDCATGENERLMRRDMMNDMAEMLEATGVKDVRVYDNGYFPAMGIHEMGTARMGRDPKTSVLNAHNQVWDCNNVFVTDGSCMASAGCQNPSLTYMALTARAAAFAVDELKKGNL